MGSSPVQVVEGMGILTGFCRNLLNKSRRCVVVIPQFGTPSLGNSLGIIENLGYFLGDTCGSTPHTSFNRRCLLGQEVSLNQT